ncbi:MAG: NADP-reducing hydrogenase subunit HndC [Candidatus Izimaplasma bacterium HR2]|nr:MAG: NADP-reducing hydrogenase subunit HndC [Candidatus Izimaplasma bacterium HR2]
MNKNILEKIKVETLKANPELNEPHKNLHEKEVRVVLKNCDIINPEDINHYIAKDGYFAINQILTEMSQEDVIKVISDSGLRGRGGGGFPTGRKWDFAYKNENDTKYIICNADEGDPGAFMDRSVLEKDPHSILEGMMIAGYAIGAETGFIYVRAEYPLAAERLQKAIDDALELNILGENIFGTKFNFNIEIRLGAGAFVCGEETALIASIEGNRGMSKNKPPYPAIEGLYGKPTIINNVETLANISQIILKGSKWFRSFGTEKSPGTKVFALAGKIKNTGLIEVPMGITLGEIIHDIGRGVGNKRKFKAVLTGGPSGGCLTEKHLDQEVDFDTLVALGSMMGSGGMIVLDDHDCMVDIAKFYLDFSVDESCGKCTPCREGTIQLYKLLEKITNGEGTLAHLDKLKKLSKAVKKTSLCGLGMTAPNPILSTLEHFYDEYLAHVTHKVCPASSCRGLIEKYIIQDNCVGCTICAKRCPVQCITGERKGLHVIDQDACIQCGECFASCNFDAIITK